jgi:hypothetical protein
VASRSVGVPPTSSSAGARKTLPLIDIFGEGDPQDGHIRRLIIMHLPDADGVVIVPFPRKFFPGIEISDLADLLGTDVMATSGARAFGGVPA